METKEIEAQKRYKLQEVENTAAVAQAHLQNIDMYGLENIVAIDPTYQGYINIRQTRIDLDRENKMKDLELVKQKVLLIKELVEKDAIDDMTAG